MVAACPVPCALAAALQQRPSQLLSVYYAVAQVPLRLAVDIGSSGEHRA